MTNETNLPADFDDTRAGTYVPADYDDDHLVETFGPLEDDMFSMDPFASIGDEAHYHHVLRDFEELLRDYGVQRIITDMEEESVASLMEYFDE